MSEEYRKFKNNISTRGLFSNPNFSLCYEYIYKVESIKVYLHLFSPESVKRTLMENLRELKRETSFEISNSRLKMIKSLRDDLAHKYDVIVGTVESPSYLRSMLKEINEFHDACMLHYEFNCIDIKWTEEIPMKEFKQSSIFTKSNKQE